MLKKLGLAVLATGTLLSGTAQATGCSKWLFSSGGYTDTKHKILMVHGISGFDNIGGLIGYFHTVPMNLCRSGADVKVANVSAFNDSEERGRQLAQDINANRYGSGKFNVIGHSQGSPTTRVAITHDAAMNTPGNGRIVSLTSVGGVNKGSKVADVIRGIIPVDSGVEGGASAIANALGELINLVSGNDRPQDSIAALETLTTPDTLALNSRHPYGVASGYCTNDRDSQVTVEGNSIRLYSLVGTRAVTNVADISDPLLGITSLAFSGETSDGLVAECSQKLGDHVGSYRMNHIDEMNHLFGLRYPFSNPVTMYRKQANRLKKAGL